MAGQSNESAERLLRAVEGIHQELKALRKEITFQRSLVARGRIPGEKLLDLAREILARGARRL